MSKNKIAEALKEERARKKAEVLKDPKYRGFEFLWFDEDLDNPYIPSGYEAFCVDVMNGEMQEKDFDEDFDITVFEELMKNRWHPIYVADELEYYLMFSGMSEGGACHYAAVMSEAVDKFLDEINEVQPSFKKILDKWEEEKCNH